MSVLFKIGMAIFAISGSAFGIWVVHHHIIPKNIEEQLEWDGYSILSSNEDFKNKLTEDYVQANKEQLKKFLIVEELDLFEEKINEIKTKCKETMSIRKTDANYLEKLGQARLFCAHRSDD